jgi:REP element-mobilizing transposase RayT
MAHSYPNLLIHCVFSTKERRDSIPEELREKLWKYLAAVGENHKLPVLEAGGTANHAHILLALPADVPLSKAVQTLKANSSRWMGEHSIDFWWQHGYGAFSVSASNAGRVRDYIRRQMEHHQKRSFEEEFVALLAGSGVSYDPKFVFG